MPAAAPRGARRIRPQSVEFQRDAPEHTSCRLRVKDGAETSTLRINARRCEKESTSVCRFQGDAPEHTSCRFRAKDGAETRSLNNRRQEGRKGIDLSLSIPKKRREPPPELGRFRRGPCRKARLSVAGKPLIGRGSNGRSADLGGLEEADGQDRVSRCSGAEALGVKMGRREVRRVITGNQLHGSDTPKTLSGCRTEEEDILCFAKCKAHSWEISHGRDQLR